MNETIFFEIRESDPVGSEIILNKVAEWSKKYSDKKISIDGYADKGTGNARINRELSEHRAKVVAGMLVKDYNISASRIDIDFKGDTEQPYAENDLNRVTICIAQ